MCSSDLPAAWLLELAQRAVGDSDGTVRIGGAEILGRLVREGGQTTTAQTARQGLQALQADPDHRVVAAALNGLQIEAPPHNGD